MRFKMIAGSDLPLQKHLGSHFATHTLFIFRPFLFTKGHSMKQLCTMTSTHRVCHLMHGTHTNAFVSQNIYSKGPGDIFVCFLILSYLYFIYFYYYLYSVIVCECVCVRVRAHAHVSADTQVGQRS